MTKKWVLCWGNRNLRIVDWPVEQVQAWVREQNITDPYAYIWEGQWLGTYGYAPYWGQVVEQDLAEVQPDEWETLDDINN